MFLYLKMNKTNGVYNVLLAYLVLIQLSPEYCEIAPLKWMKNDPVQTKVFELLGKRKENISKKFFRFAYETLLACQVSEKLIF